MRPPDLEQLGELLEDLGRRLRGADEKDTGVSGAQLLRRTREWADGGYPSNVGYDPGRPRPVLVQDEGEEAKAPPPPQGDPTGEALFRRTERASRLHQDGVFLMRMLEENALSLDRLFAVVFSTPHREPADPDPCESCARAGHHADMAHFSDVGGRLDRDWRLCTWCYPWTWRHGRLPTIPEVHRWHERGQVPIRVGGANARKA